MSVPILMLQRPFVNNRAPTHRRWSSAIAGIIARRRPGESRPSAGQSITNRDSHPDGVSPMLEIYRPAVLAGLLLLASTIPSGVALAQHPGYGTDVANMDLGVNPRQNFYQFANGGWLDRAKIPDDKFSYETFTELYDLTNHQLLAILWRGEPRGAQADGRFQ
jgi:hypothetical protein